ncbi:polysaccharide deacetylase family protein [Amycolatopsis sp. SID8362]|uniref:polysaccharide deacetylase family protein n=1 Tax=Amycolatopsis sp. SID8362 TaxID=2690346 RepID=UPI00136FD049|nr:polysaccharide deacetylase family protein [Amycolatopsis sp. SID8362]NBH04792.1 polysaccharide deacetylase family protein [Amycolatopsis sp. SID8362]NED41492.1 polysaccharide deacetylase family protein [Amycolatopsis sp. SID8362]
MPLVLMYHSVARYTEDPYLITVSPDRFEAQMRWLWRRGMRGVSMRALLAGHDRGTAAGLVGLTFDDGYADFADTVARVLAWYGFTATVFAVAGKLGETNDWDGDGPRKQLLDAEQLRALVTLGIEIGSHGMRHNHIPAQSPRTADEEIVHSREALESIIEEPVTGFCYPYGDLDRETITSVRSAGYDYACAVHHSGFDSRFAIPRTYVGDRDRGLRLRAKRLRHRVSTRGSRLEPAARG